MLTFIYLMICCTKRFKLDASFVAPTGIDLGAAGRDGVLSDVPNMGLTVRRTVLARRVILTVRRADDQG